MATNQDGSQLWFTSAVRPVGLTLDQGEHLWRWDGQRVQLVASPNRARDARTIFRVATGPRPGQVAWEEYRPCLFSAGCGFRNLHTSQIRRGLELQDYLGPVQFSEDGRYFYNYRTDAQNLGDARFSHIVEDWETGQTRTIEKPGVVSRPLPLGGRWITNSGAVLVREGANLALQSLSGTSTPLGPMPDTTGPDFRLFVDPLGRFFVYERNGQIRLRNLMLEEQAIAPVGRLVGATAKGEVLYIARNTQNSDEFRAYSYLNGGTRVLAVFDQVPETGIEDAVLSRDESTIFLLLSNGSIVRISGEARTVLSGYGRRVVSTRNFNGLVSSFTALNAWAPGGTHFLMGRNLQDGVIQSDFGAIPIHYANPQRLIFEVPTGFLTTPRCFEDCPFVRLQFPDNLELPLHSYGLVPFNIVRQEAIPLLPERPENPLRYLIHGDWRGPVTASDIARPGEIVHVYAVNLEPVNNRVACFAGNAVTSTTPVEVLYTGSIPGLTGIQQLSLRVPAGDIFTEILCERSLSFPVSFGFPPALTFP